MAKIAVIVLNYRQPTLTLATVRSLLKISLEEASYHLFLVNNNCLDDSLNIFEEKLADNPKITLVSTGSNLGYAGGNNFGIKLALKEGYDYCLIINNDVLVDPKFLQYLYETAKNTVTPAIIGPKIYFAKGYEFHHDRYQNKELGRVIWSAGGLIDWKNIYASNLGVDQVDRGQFDQINSNLDFITGCCLLIPKEIFHKIGFFDERYFMYLEDVDFCYRAKLQGFKIIYQPKSSIWHINAGSSSSGSSLHDYFITRNRLLFGLKYARPRSKLALTRQAVRLLFTGRKWQKRAVIDYYLKHLGKGSWREISL
ncbi:MAG TPA: glycosyltransferase family 2 protein [Candidatus Woesebacteria bacterium]|nr:glycosyltransferase family 2 protein [Candidatus Woesebacteria bacterium]HRT39940.1 glycosyltransferase family 2 protein [Candidatus Woesebacteria bacterium]